MGGDWYDAVELTTARSAARPETWWATTRGGHLLAGRVWPTLEVIITGTHAGLRKTYRPDIGLALIDLEK